MPRRVKFTCLLRRGSAGRTYRVLGTSARSLRHGRGPESGRAENHDVTYLIRSDDGWWRMDAERGVFWDDLARDLKDPQFLREYVAQSIRIATIDRIVNELDGAREAAGLSKAELARAINSEPATVRRLFSAGHVNPTLGTLAEVAAVLGMRVVLEPLEAEDRKRITGPLLAGSTDDPVVLARRLDAMRGERDAIPATA